MNNWFRITKQTIIDYWKLTLIISLLFMGIAAMYALIYPAFKDAIIDLINSGFAESFSAFRGSEDLGSYIGFLNIELYQIFWILILAIIIGFFAATSISKEIESKTIDLLLSNPVSRKQIVFERFLGFIPFILIVNFSVMATVLVTTAAIGEEINVGYLFMTHLVSIPYFLTVVGIGIIISVIIDEKMKASIFVIAILIGMYIFESISLLSPKYESLGFISITHYFDPYDVLKSGDVDLVGLVILFVIAFECVLFSMLYFEKRDIRI